jgi:hypothetical protein
MDGSLDHGADILPEPLVLLLDVVVLLRAAHPTNNQSKGPSWSAAGGLVYREVQSVVHRCRVVSSRRRGVRQ